MLKPKIWLIYCTALVNGAEILGIVPHPSFSHQVAFFDLWSELSLRGHKVTVITTNPQKNEKLTNLNEIDMKQTYEIYKNISPVIEKTVTWWNFHNWFHNVSSIYTQDQLSHYLVQDLIHNKKKFDVILLEAFYPEYLGFAEIYNCPTILISSLDVFTKLHWKMGNPAHPVLNPNFASSFSPPLGFKDRVVSSLYSLYLELLYKYINYPSKNTILRRFFNNTSTVDELLDKIDMVFHNVNPVLQPIRAIGPSTINTIGLRRFTVKPLPEELKIFLDASTGGFVYFSLGSSVKSKDLQKVSLKSIVEALRELPLKVLWKFEAEPSALQTVTDNVKLIKWAPQIDILAHPNIKLFVTQGGLQSMEEAIYSEVPCVVIPFYVDQQQNAELMKKKGFAKVVGRHPYIKKEELKSGILEVLNNPMYKSAVKELKLISMDTPMTGLDQAIWWTEYVIRNNGTKHLRNPAADLPLYQFYLLDVIGFLLIAALVSLTVSYFVLKKIYRLLRTAAFHRSVLLGKNYSKP